MRDLARIIRRTLARIAALAALGVVAACTWPQAQPPAAVATAPGPALWKVQSPQATIYLFGTVHALPSDVDWFDARVARAFAEADELTTEIDMSNQVASASALSAAGLLARGQNLRALLPPDLRARFEAALSALGLPVDALDQVEPWFAALNLSLLPLMQAGFDPSEGVELMLSARAEGKQLSALETIEEQVALFDDMPMEAQLALLSASLEAAPRAPATVRAMVERWQAGDAEGLARLMNAEFSDPALYQRLLVDRNRRWVEWIEARLQRPGTVFIAVGAGHLAGAGSVQELLAARGHEVVRIWQ